ncbi:T9SS type A sorting domain-containing protein [bacterium]|nr:T9SS type A sorting domain-containing protein [bacterium]
MNPARYPLSLLTILVLCFAAPVFSAPAPIQSLENSDQFRLESVGDGAIVHFETPDVQWLDRGDGTHLPQMIGAGWEGVEGAPQLPVYGRLIAVPAGMEARLVDVRVDWEPAGRYTLSHDAGEEGNVQLDPSLTHEVVLRADEVVTLGETRRWRDIRVARMAVRPMRYHPDTGEVQVATNIETEIEYVPVEEDAYDPPGVSEALYPVYTHYVLGAEGELDAEEITRGSILFIAPDSWEDELEPLMEWRRRCGWETEFVPTSESGTQRNTLRNFIWNYYETSDPPLEYVVLAGDIDAPANIQCFYIPSGGWLDPNIGTDQKYTYDPSGGDSFEDVLPRYHIGRISVDSPTQLQIVVAKILQYEREPDISDLDRFRSALVIADATTAHSTKMTKKWVRQKLLDVGYDDIPEVYRDWSNPNPSISLINNPINGGLAWVNYRGFGAHTGWSGPYYYNWNVQSLSNGNKLPIVTSMVCGGGAFDELDDDPCFGEQWIRNGSLNNLTGAVMFVAPSEIDTHTRWNNIVDGGWYRAMLDFDMRTAGPVLLGAKLETYHAYPNLWNPDGGNTNSVFFYFHTYNILGDPALQMRVEVPQDVNVEIGEELTTRSNHVPVHVTFAEDASPVVDAMAVVTNEENQILGSARTDAGGFADIPVGNGVTSATTLNLTVTRPDIIPFDEEITHEESAGLALDEFAPVEDENDPATNGDGYFNPGELVMPAASFDVSRPDGLTNLALQVEVLDPHAEATVPAQAWPYVALNETVTVSAPRIRLDPTWGALHRLDLRYTFTADDEFQRSFLVTLETILSPELRVADTEVTSSGGSYDLQVELANAVDAADAENLTGRLRSMDRWVDVTSEEATWSLVESGTEGTASDEPFSFTVSDTAYPGRVLQFSLDLCTPDGRGVTLPLEVIAEEPDQTDPTGPAGPGYYIYEDIDTEIPLDPEDFEYSSIRTQGTNLYLYDSGNNGDESTTIDLPFEFPYWNETYDEITVCSNGWFSFETTDLYYMRNRSIPAALTPAGGVAVLWSDLVTSGGGVYTYHDQTDGLFYIEWYNWHEYNTWTNDSRFQAILLDPDEWETPGGNGIIVLTYGDVSNSWNAGDNYYTVGIISPDGTDGLEYEWSNTRPSSVNGLEDDRVLAIACRGNDGRAGAALSFDVPTVRFNSFDGASSAGRTIRVTNTGDMPVECTAGLDEDWASVHPASGSLTPGSMLELHIQADPSTTAAGLNETVLTLEPLHGEDPHTLQVQYVKNETTPSEVPFILEISTETVAPGEEFSDIDLFPYYRDPDSDAGEADILVWSDDPAVLPTVDEDGLLTFEVEDEWEGRARITIESADADLNTVQRTVMLSNREDLDDAPRFTLFGPRRYTVDTGEEVSFNAAAFDPDGEDVELTWYHNGTMLNTGPTADITFETAGYDTVAVVADDGTLQTRNWWAVKVGLVSVDDTPDAPLPDHFVLEDLYPNPFNSRVAVRYALPQTSDVKLKVFNVIGREVLAETYRAVEAGRHHLSINGYKWASGMYMLQLEANGTTATRKMVLVK